MPDVLLPRDLVAEHPGAGGQLVRLRGGQRHHRLTMLHARQLRVSKPCWDCRLEQEVVFRAALETALREPRRAEHERDDYSSFSAGGREGNEVPRE